MDTLNWSEKTCKPRKAESEAEEKEMSDVETNNIAFACTMPVKFGRNTLKQ